MHQFPATSDLQFLLGKTLEQVCLGSWDFQFVFDKGSISVEGDLEHIDNEGVVRRHGPDADRLAPLYLHHLLGQTVTTAFTKPFCLTMTFARGDLLRIYSDQGQFECGQIYDDEGRLTVF